MESKNDGTFERCGPLMGDILRAALFQKSVQTRQNCERALCVSMHERPEVSVIFPLQFLALLSHLKAVRCTVQHFWKSFESTPRFPHESHLSSEEDTFETKYALLNVLGMHKK